MYSIESQLSKNPNILLSELYLIYTIFIRENTKSFHFMKLRYGIYIIEYQNIESAKVVSIQIKIIMKRILLIIFKSLK